jgi:surface protein
VKLVATVEKCTRDVSKITDMGHMFSKASSFNANISTWNVSKVIVLSYMFQGAIVFNQDISSWDVSRGEELYDMFYDAIAFNINLCKWDRKLTCFYGIRDMFVNTSCPNENDLDYDCGVLQNMCHNCV